MTTKVQICNRALTSYLGLARITSLDETSPGAQACSIHYDDTLRAAFERHWWAWATGRQVLAELENDRTAEWAYRYQMPADAVSLRWVNDPAVARVRLAAGQSPDSAREISGQSIYCDVPQAAAEFTKIITDPSLYPQYFADLVSAMLAVSMAQMLTEDRVRTQAAREGAMEALDRAIPLDARNSPPFVVGVPSWLSDRGIT